MTRAFGQHFLLTLCLFWRLFWESECWQSSSSSSLSSLHRTSNAHPSLALLSSSSKLRVSTEKDAAATSSSSSSSSSSTTAAVPSFLSTQTTFLSECDNVNRPPSLNILLRTIQQLTTSASGSDIRGRFVDHARLGSISSVAHEIGRQTLGSTTKVAPLTPLAAYCLGHAFAELLLFEKSDTEKDDVVVAVGVDPRPHSVRLADAISRGMESVTVLVEGEQQRQRCCKVVYTGLATTPACAAFCRESELDCDAAVMVTASHLPVDRNGFKFFYTKDDNDGDNNEVCLLTSQDMAQLGLRAMDCAATWFNKGLLPPSSGTGAVMCSQHVDWMPRYAETLKQAIQREVGTSSSSEDALPLQNLKIVLNAGNGSGGFFQQVLKDLGADVSASIHVKPDGAFANGIPNPEYKPMLDATVQACEAAQADLGIMLDTDADRCGFVVPARVDDETGKLCDYQALNRNRLIALLSVIFARSSPGCKIVTDSVTSEGLAAFLEDNLGLEHVRFLKGYANVINKAKELDAEMGIETSGHCAMKENGYLDDGTYTAVKIIGLLARELSSKKDSSESFSLLDLISDMEELDEVNELRMPVLDESLSTMETVFDFCALEVERLCDSRYEHHHRAVVEPWVVDRDNLEGIRVRIGGSSQFFMLRKSLHDPLISLQIEAKSKEDARNLVVQPLLKLFESEQLIKDTLDISVLKEY